jgi:hypothetical protein
MAIKIHQLIEFYRSSTPSERANIVRKSRVRAREKLKKGPRLPHARRAGSEWIADCPSCTSQSSVYAKQDKHLLWSWRCMKCEARAQDWSSLEDGSLLILRKQAHVAVRK